MSYTVEKKTIEPIRVAYLNYQGDVRKVNKVFPSVFKAIKGNVNGAPFFHYYEMNPTTKIGHLELCAPTTENTSNLAIQIKEFPAFSALCTTHIGSYDTIMNAYDAIRQYAIENHITLTPEFRETYIKGAGAVFKGNPNDYITEIAIPIEENH
ncbi:TPA: GyrI-like domain-containing protein [Enterococcus faecium]